MTSRPPSSKVLLVADRRPSPAIDDHEPAVRRYRLARLRFDPRPSDPQSRYDHLKRIYE